jgi:hypothetical protein
VRRQLGGRGEVGLGRTNLRLLVEGLALLHRRSFRSIAYAAG